MQTIKQNQTEVIIKAKTGWFDIDIKELLVYKDLIFMFVKRNFVLIYKQTILGPLWVILNPLLTSVIFTFVFGKLAGLSTDGVPQLLFYMASNTIWGLFNSSVTGTANTFTSNAGIFGKIYFPRLAIPISHTLTALINCGIQLIILAVFYVYYFVTGANIHLSLSVFLVPVLLIQCIALGLAVGIIVSSLTTKYRDLAIAVGFGMQLWMYITPIVYPLSTTSGWMYKVLLLNPVTPIVNNFRYALLGTDVLVLWPWAFSAGITVILLVVGVILFSRVEKTFMDTV